MKILAKYPLIVLHVELTEMEARNLRFFLLNATQNNIQGKEEAHELGYSIEQRLPLSDFSKDGEDVSNEPGQDE